MGSVKGDSGLKILNSVLLIILSAILIGSVLRIVFGGSSFSFSAFLNYLHSVPQIEITNVNIFTINGEWAILDSLRRFLNNIMSIFNFGAWMCIQLLNCLSYIIYFVKFIIFV